MAQQQEHDLMAPEADVQRIMHTGTIWFAMAFLADALVFGMLLASGWRPGLLPWPLAIIWWLGAALNGLSLGLLAWSGCPILETSVPVADRNKVKTMQLGTALIIISSAMALFAVLLGPAS